MERRRCRCLLAVVVKDEETKTVFKMSLQREDRITHDEEDAHAEGSLREDSTHTNTRAHAGCLTEVENNRPNLNAATTASSSPPAGAHEHDARA